MAEIMHQYITEDQTDDENLELESQEVQEKRRLVKLYLAVQNFLQEANSSQQEPSLSDREASRVDQEPKSSEQEARS